MTKTINVLLIDDHPIIIDAYKNTLEKLNDGNDEFNFIINSAKCCDSALLEFKSSLKDQPYDLVFVDIRLPSKNPKIKSGEELCSIFKSLSPNTKYIIITGHYDAFIFHNILQNINPDGLLYKSDIGSDTIREVVLNALNNVPYYSATVLQLLRKSISSKIVLNDIDKLLLYKLANGTKTKDLKESLPLSQGGVEKRKRFLKEVFNTQKQNDKALIKSAEKKGFL
ncbi:response regulator [Psychroserpens luteolus]|uniref:response regulator n=1 Tax=Psychroserpens luteolus TaxID=2855840 RepID=UPI001E634B14|nr:response regulator [Psychroserpens luteolus]MCD2257582.1 response regulator [Psychroserpens luteolus]